MLYRLRGLRYLYNQWWLKTFYVPTDSKLVSLLRLPYRWFPPYPTSIEIEASTACPFKCTICEHTYWDEPAKNMSFEQFKSMVDAVLEWGDLVDYGSHGTLRCPTELVDDVCQGQRVTVR